MKRYSFGYLSSERQAIMGLAILWVMFFHSSVNLGRFPLINTLKRFGNLGVDIFLLLSGIGLFNSAQRLRREYEDHWVVAFYRKRVIRILPATIICLLPWYLYLYREQDVNMLRWLLDITSLSFWIDGKNRGWYVALSIVLYLMFPIFYCMLVKGKSNRLLSFIVLIAIDIAFNTAIAIYKPDWFGKVNLALCRVPVFILGCFLASKVKDNIEQGWLALICLLAAILLVFLRIRFIEPLKIYGIWRYLYGALGFCITVVTSVIFHSFHGKWLSKIFSFFGKYTLELYLTHTQILTVMTKQMKPYFSGVMINVLAVVLSIIMAVIVHEGLSYVIKRISK